MKEKEVLIFDLDGTLVDTTPIGFRKINKNLAQLGLPPVSENFLRQHWGKKAEDIFALICQEVGATAKQLLDFKENDKEMLTDYALHPGISWVLTNLKEHGYIIGLLTSRTNDSLNLLAGRIGLNLNFFEFLQTATHFYHHKPSGRVFGPLLNWVRHRGLTANNIVYFGDTVNYDLAATRDCDPMIDFVGVVSGVNTCEEFLAAGVPAERIVPSFEEFPLYLQNMLMLKYLS